MFGSLKSLESKEWSCGLQTSPHRFEGETANRLFGSHSTEKLKPFWDRRKRLPLHHRKAEVKSKNPLLEVQVWFMSRDWLFLASAERLLFLFYEDVDALGPPHAFALRHLMTLVMAVPLKFKRFLYEQHMLSTFLCGQLCHDSPLQCQIWLSGSLPFQPSVPLASEPMSTSSVSQNGGVTSFCKSFKHLEKVPLLQICGHVTLSQGPPKQSAVCAIMELAVQSVFF